MSNQRMSGQKKKQTESTPISAGPHRQPRVIIVAGRNGAGKTTLAKMLVSQHRKAFIIAPSREWGEWGDTKALAAKAIAGGCDALVLDDADAYLPSSPDQFWIRLFTTNRHLGMDVMLLTRRPQALPFWSVSAASHAYLLPLGPRERIWCERQLGAVPPQTGYTPTIVTL